jgi:hypothetical protein
MGALRRGNARQCQCFGWPQPSLHAPRSLPLAPCPCSLLLAPCICLPTGFCHVDAHFLSWTCLTTAQRPLEPDSAEFALPRPTRSTTRQRGRPWARPSPRLLLMLHTCMPSSIPPWRRLTALAALRPLSAPGAMHACRRLALSSTQHSNIRRASSATSSCSVRFLEAAVTAALPPVMVWLAVVGCGCLWLRLGHVTATLTWAPSTCSPPATPKTPVRSTTPALTTP